jgi:hypothetical protein
MIAASWDFVAWEQNKGGLHRSHDARWKGSVKAAN